MKAEEIRILVVDDEPSIVELLGEYLATRGHPVQTASSGEEATRLLDSNEFELVLSDIKMPGLDGLQLLEHIQQRNLPTSVILMTGYGTIESAIRAMKQGALDYLQKPFKLREIYEIIEDAMSRPRQGFSPNANPKLLALQQAVSALESPEELSDLYGTLCKHVSLETGANAALVAFREPERKFWVSYHCTDHAAFRTFDIQHAGVVVREGLHRSESPVSQGDEASNVLLTPIPFQASVNSKNPPCGFLALAGLNRADPAITDCAKACAHLVGDALTRQFLTAHLLAFSDQQSSLLFKERPSLTHPDRVEALAVSIAQALEMKEPELRAVEWVVRLQDQVPGPDEILHGGALDVMTLGGGGLPLSVMSHLETALYALGERHDGTGSPNGISGDDIPRVSQVVAAATWWDHSCVSRRFAPRLGHPEALEQLKSLSGTAFHPEIAQALRTLFTES